MKKMWSTVQARKCVERARNGNVDFVKAMVQWAPNPNPVDTLGQIILETNLWGLGQVGDKRGLTPLHVAAFHGHLEVCRLIMEACQDKNPGEGWGSGWTPLHGAAENGHLEVCSLIIDAIDNKNPPALNGYTPLHSAAQEGHLEVVRLIVENITDKSPVNDDGETPLDLASNEEVRRLLE